MSTTVRALRVAIFLLALAWAIPSRADDLDETLSHPPSASLTSEDATHRIETLRALIPKHPERADEIEAYLIPFVRATQPPPVEPTPPPAPPAATPKPLLLLKMTDGTATTMKATSYRRQGAVVLVSGANGSRAVLQALTVAGELPWYEEADLESGAVDLNDLATRYEAFATATPALRPALKKEYTRFRKMQQTRDDAIAEKSNAVQARLTEATSETYDPAKAYPAAKLARLLLTAEKARTEVPELAAKIDEWATPFREHLGKLFGGQSLVNGAWVSNAEMARAARERRQAAFSSGLDYQIGTEAFPAGLVRGLILPPLAAGAVALLAGAGLLVIARRRLPFVIGGAALLAITPLALATLFFLATRNPALLASTIPPAGEEPIIEALSQAAGLEEGTSTPEITEDALNSFLTRHVRLTSDSDTTTPAENRREAIAVRFLPGRVAVFEMIHSLGFNWIVRVDLALQPSAAGQPAVTLLGAHLGALKCPAGFSAELWKNLEPQFATILDASRLAGQFAAQSPGAGKIELKALAKTPPSTP